MIAHVAALTLSEARDLLYGNDDVIAHIPLHRIAWVGLGDASPLSGLKQHTLVTDDLEQIESFARAYQDRPEAWAIVVHDGDELGAVTALERIRSVSASAA